jgi:preprotein translocase subunit SecY
MGERIILATAVALSLIALAAIVAGALDAVAAGVLVLALLLFVTAAFRVVDEIERRQEEPTVQRRGSSRRWRRRA